MSEEKIITKKVQTDFNRKYRVLQSEIKNRETRLQKLIANGGQRLLDIQKKQIDDELKTICGKLSQKNYKQNLEAKRDFLDFKIKHITNAEDNILGFGGTLTEEQEKEFEEYKKEKAEEKQLAEIKNGIYNEFIDLINNTSADDKIQDVKDIVEPLYKTIRDNFENSGQIGVKLNNNKMSTVFTSGSFENGSEKILKCIDDAYKQFTDNAEKIQKMRDEAKKLAEMHAQQTILACKKSLLNDKTELENKISIKLERELEQLGKEFAEIPIEIQNQFKDIENFLYSLANGFQKSIVLPSTDLVNNVNISLDSLLDQMQSLVDPVFSTVLSLPIPIPPVAQPIVDLIKMAKTMGGDIPNLTDEQKKLIDNFKASIPNPKACIPADWMETIESMFKTLCTIFYKIMFGIISLVFDLFAAVMSALSAVGAPLPYPLNLVPNIISLLPKLKDLMFNLPEVLYQILLDKLKTMVAQVAALGTSVGSAVVNVFNPTPACPEAVKQQLSAELLTQIEKEKELELAKKLEKIEKEKQEKEKAMQEKLAYDAEYKDSPLYKAEQEELKKIEEAKEKAKKEAEEQAKKDAANTISTLVDYETYRNTKLKTEFMTELVKRDINPHNIDIVELDTLEKADNIMGSMSQGIQNNMSWLQSGAQNVSSFLKSI